MRPPAACAFFSVFALTYLVSLLLLTANARPVPIVVNRKLQSTEQASFESASSSRHDHAHAIAAAVAAGVVGAATANGRVTMATTPSPFAPLPSLPSTYASPSSSLTASAPPVETMLATASSPPLKPKPSTAQDKPPAKRLSIFSIIHPALHAAFVQDRSRNVPPPTPPAPLATVVYRSFPLRGTEPRDRVAVGLPATPLPPKQQPLPQKRHVASASVPTSNTVSSATGGSTGAAAVPHSVASDGTGATTARVDNPHASGDGSRTSSANAEKLDSVRGASQDPRHEQHQPMVHADGQQQQQRYNEQQHRNHEQTMDPHYQQNPLEEQRLTQRQPAETANSHEDKHYEGTNVAQNVHGTELGRANYQDPVSASALGDAASPAGSVPSPTEFDSAVYTSTLNGLLTPTPVDRSGGGMVAKTTHGGDENTSGSTDRSSSSSTSAGSRNLDVSEAAPTLKEVREISAKAAREAWRSMLGAARKAVDAIGLGEAFKHIVPPSAQRADDASATSVPEVGSVSSADNSTATGNTSVDSQNGKRKENMVERDYTEQDVNELVYDILRQIQSQRESIREHATMLADTGRWTPPPSSKTSIGTGTVRLYKNEGEENKIPTKSAGKNTEDGHLMRGPMLVLRTSMLVSPDDLAHAVTTSTKRMLERRDRPLQWASASRLLTDVRVRLAQMLEPDATAVPAALSSGITSNIRERTGNVMTGIPVRIG